MESHGMWKKCADVSDAKFIDQQLGEFENAGQQFVDGARNGGVVGSGRHLGVMIADHRDT